MADIATTSPVQEELVACLQPYESVVGQSVDVRRHEAFLWLHGSPSGQVAADRQLMEALELLVLLACADWSLWKEVVTKMVRPSRASSWDQQSDEQPAEVGVSLDSVATWSEDLCEFLVASSQNTLSSFTFHSAKQLMLRVLAEQGQTVDEVPVQVARDYGADIGVQLVKISQLVSRQRQCCQAARQAADGSITSKPFYFGLRIREVDISGIEERTDALLLGYAAEIASCGAAVDCLRPSFFKVQKQHPHKFMDAMIRLFPLGNQLETRESSGVACVSVGRFDLMKAYPAILSAVAASSCVRKIEFFPIFETMGMVAFPKHQRWLWSWLAYSAFLAPRSAGQHHIQEIWINAQMLNQGAVNAMTHILQAANPIAALFNHDESDTAPETVAASRFALLDPSSASGRRLTKWTCGQCLYDLPVIKRADDWVSVLLPRWGQAWVHHDDVVPSQSNVAATLQIQSIQDLILDDVEEHLRPATVAMLHMVGQRIRHLGVASVHERFRKAAEPLDWEALILEIFEACPVLESLKLYSDNMKIATLHRILDAFASGSCRLQRLHMQSGEFSGQDRFLPSLINALSNRQHPARYQLKEITLGNMPFASTMSPSIVSSCIAMLKENFVLQRFDIKFFVPYEYEAQFADCKAQLKEFDNERIDGRRDPTPILAFLSVVAAERGQDTRVRAIQQLDARVMSLIFAFMTPSFIRRVRISEEYFVEPVERLIQWR